MESRKPWGSILKWSSMTWMIWGTPMTQETSIFLVPYPKVIVTLAGLPEEERKWVTLRHPGSPCVTLGHPRPTRHGWGLFETPINPH